MSADVTTLYATPRLGWLAIWDSGLSLELDLGVQLPISSDAQISGGNADARSQAQSIANAVGQTALPSVGFRLGYFL